MSTATWSPEFLTEDLTDTVDAVRRRAAAARQDAIRLGLSRSVGIVTAFFAHLPNPFDHLWHPPHLPVR